MANIKSAIKRAKQTEARTVRNKMRRSRVRGSVRQAEEAIASGDSQKALAAMRKAESELARAGQSGVLHARAVRRKVSRLAAKMKSLSKGEQSSAAV